MWRFCVQRTDALRETFYSVDILRGLAALAVLVFHYVHFTMGNGNISIPAERLYDVPILSHLRWLLDNGSLAVQLFWTISGFVFMNVYAGRDVDGWTFAVNRFARLYPLHFVTLLVVAAIQFVSYANFGHYVVYSKNSVGNFILNLFFASAWISSKTHSFNGPIWSVSVEILIYILFWIYARFFKPNLLGTLLLCVAFYGAHALTKNMVMLCGAFFFAGSAAYCIVSLLAPRYRILVAVLSLLFCIAWGAVLQSSFLDEQPLTPRLLALFVPGLLCLSLSELAGLQSVYKRFRAVGDVTYSTYLWHSPLQMLFLVAAAFGLVPVSMVLTNGFVIGYLVVVVVVAYASYRLLERPAQDFLRARLLRKRKPVQLVSAP